jgi:hypothetical protein
MVSNKAIRQALYQKLNVSSVTTLLGSGSASLVHELAPPSATYPLCLFARQSDVSTLRFGGNAFDNQVWQVKGIVRSTSSSVAEDIDKAVRDLLDFGSLSITGGSLMHMARISGFEYAENEGDEVYRHVGSLYRLYVQT